MPLLTPGDSAKGHTDAHKIVKDCERELEYATALFSTTYLFRALRTRLEIRGRRSKSKRPGQAWGHPAD